MAKHLSPSRKKQIKLPEPRARSLPRLSAGRPGRSRKTYAREFSVAVIAPVLFALLLFIAAALLRVELWIKVILYGIAALAACFELCRRCFVRVLHGRFPDEDLLILLAAILAFAIGEYAAAAAGAILYRVAELALSYAMARGEGGADTLLSILPETAKVEAEYGLTELVPEMVGIGDVIQVNANEVIPLDGEVVEGVSEIDTARLTGKIQSYPVNVGSEVFSGTVNLHAPLRIRVKRSFEDSAAARLVTSFRLAGSNESRFEGRLELYAAWFAPAMALLALLCGVIPPIFTGAWSAGLHRAVVLLLIASPSALLLSVPLSFMGALVCSARHGILVAGKNRVEKLARVRTMIFGKTGTITEGRYEVSEVFPSKVSERALLSIAAAAESNSRHPIAQALKQAAGWTNDMAAGVIEVEEIPGRGVSAFIEGKHVYVGNAALLEDHGIWYQVPSRSGAAIHVAVENSYWGHILISDRIRDGAFEALEDLRAQKVDTMVMLTGDVLSVTRTIASALNFDMVKAELDPQGKLSAIDYLQRGKGERTTLAYVGDGINDEPMFRRSDLGIAINALHDPACFDYADIAVMDDDITLLPQAKKIAVSAFRIALMNLIVVCAIKLVLLVLTFTGSLPIVLAAVLDTAGAVFAAFNALRSFLVD